MNLEDFPEVPAHVRMIVWLGLEKHQEDWTNREQTEGDFCVYAETVGAFHFHHVLTFVLLCNLADLHFSKMATKTKTFPKEEIPLIKRVRGLYFKL